jgi:hypothetical protein
MRHARMEEGRECHESFVRGMENVGIEEASSNALQQVLHGDTKRIRIQRLHRLLRLVTKKNRIETGAAVKEEVVGKSLINRVPVEGIVFWIVQRYWDALKRVGAFINRDIVPGAAHPILLGIDAVEGVVATII